MTISGFSYSVNVFLKLPGFEFCKPLLRALEISKLTYHCLFPAVAETVKMSHVVWKFHISGLCL